MSNARSPAKLSDVTIPHATSSPSPFSTSVRSSPVAFTRSPKNDAPRWSSTSRTDFPECDRGGGGGGGGGGARRGAAPPPPPPPPPLRTRGGLWGRARPTFFV